MSSNSSTIYIDNETDQLLEQLCAKQSRTKIDEIRYLIKKELGLIE